MEEREEDEREGVVSNSNGIGGGGYADGQIQQKRRRWLCLALNPDSNSLVFKRDQF